MEITKHIETMEGWSRLKARLKLEGYTAYGYGMSWYDTEGFTGSFILNEHRVYVNTHNEEVQKDILAYNRT